MSESRKSVWIGISCYALWGFFPIYWKWLADLGATEILAHRFIWSFVFYAAVFLALRRRRASFRAKLTARQAVLSVAATALIGLNWGTYIYGVNSGRVLETSLAYFLNPLLSVAVGVFFFREPFPLALKVAVALATLGIGIQAAFAAEFPWIALTLATTFCVYGVVKKVIGLDASFGSLLEGIVGLVPALGAAYLLREAAPFSLETRHWILLAGSGVVTGLPLFLFAIAAQSLPYSLLGMMQFIAPTLQFLVGWLLYGEPLDPVKVLSFCTIWLGVGFYLADRLARLASASRRAPTARPPAG